MIETAASLCPKNGPKAFRSPLVGALDLWNDLSAQMAKVKGLDIFSVRDLRLRSGELLRDAEEGRLAVITKHGRPAILALPFDERLLNHGVARALALHLFEAGRVTLARAAKLAEMPVEEFVELLGVAGVDAVSYPPEDLESEVEAAG